MKTLHVSVANKIATYHDRDGVIVCNNNDYVIAFAFDSEWDESAVKTARFIYNGFVEDVVFSGNTVAVPVIKNALSVTVGVFSGDLKTTTPATIECKKSILCSDGVPPDPTDDVYNQIIELLNLGGGAGSGKDGFSPTITATKLTNGYLLSITDVNGTQSIVIMNGTDGKNGTDGIDGNDGVSPTIEVKPISGGHRVEITDTNGTKSFNVMNGTDATVDMSGLESKVSTLEQQVADLLYEAIAITSFSHNAGVKEYGETVTSVTLSWTINKTPAKLELTDKLMGTINAGTSATGEGTYSGYSITFNNNISWTLVATDEEGATDSKTITITFCNGVYYGAAAEPTEHDSAFVLGLTKELRSNRKPSFSVTAGEGEYIYYCLPTRMGKCAFTLGGFNGGFILIDTITFTNQSGYSEPYYIYRSDYANLGSPLVTVSEGGG